MTPADDWTLERLLFCEQEEDRRAAWRYLFGKIEAYPADPIIRPLAPPKGQERAKRFVVVELGAADAKGTPEASTAVIRTFNGNALASMPLGQAANPALALTGVLFKAANRGALLVFPDGARSALHRILRWYAAGLTELGYTLQPFVSGSDIRALQVRKGRASWWLCDLAALAPAVAGGAGVRGGPGGGEPGVGGVDLRLVHHTLCALQSRTILELEIALRPTVGGAAIAALRRSLPAGFAKFRPQPLLVAMLRQGRGFRGGYVWARPHRGATWQYDLTRAYAWALGQPLPRSSQLARWHGISREEGVWLCRVEGEGVLPAPLAPWLPAEKRFGPPRLWYGGACLAVLTGAELPGLRALGYRVYPSWGYAFRETWAATAFVDKLAGILAADGRGGALDGYAKALGNAAYGRMAMRPERQAVMYSAEAPAGGWYPFVTVDGEVLEGLWARPERVYSASMQLDIAATITGRVRGRLWETAALAASAGVGIVSCDTDSLTTTATIPSSGGADGRAIGEWRLVAHDGNAAIAGARLSSLAGRTVTAGIPGSLPQVVEAVMVGDDIRIAGRSLNLPWLAAQQWSDVVWEPKARGAPR